MKSTASWLILLIAGILLIVIGFEGALGLVVAVAFSPGSLAIYGETQGFNSDPSTSGIKEKKFPTSAKSTVTTQSAL